MISTDSHIIQKLYGNRVLVAKQPDDNDPRSGKQEVIDRLKKRDSEVRTHESAHSSSPELIKIGSTQYAYTIGPDGKAYATGGKVALSTGPAKNPEQALRKAEALKNAAVAPGEPSSQDVQAYNAAVDMENEAKNMIYTKNRKLTAEKLHIPKGRNFNIYA